MKPPSIPSSNLRAFAAVLLASLAASLATVSIWRLRESVDEVVRQRNDVSR